MTSALVVAALVAIIVSIVLKRSGAAPKTAVMALIWLAVAVAAAGVWFYANSQIDK